MPGQLLLLNIVPFLDTRYAHFLPLILFHICSSHMLCYSSAQVIAMEAESEAVAMLTTGDGLESKFAALEGGTVEDELAALKQGMLGPGKSNGPVAALPEGRPVKDAIDMELEELRKKARE
jgi:hypothetical protein